MSAPETIAPSESQRSGGRRILRYAFSFPVLLGAFLVASVFVGSGIYFAEGDTWLHILIGEDILASRTWPTTDHYSFTARGNGSMAFEWLGEMIMALTDRLGGLSGLMVLLIALGAVLALLIYYCAYLRCGNAKAAFLATIFLLPFVIIFLRLRPQLLGYTFLVITLICLEHFRQGRHKALWILPGVFALWVNTHGTFIFGLLVLGLYWVCGLFSFRRGGLVARAWTAQERRSLALSALLSVLALMVTPYGTRIAGFTVHVLLDAPLGMSRIVEYQPLGAFGDLLRPFLILLLAFLLTEVLVRSTYRFDETLVLLLAICLAFVHMRLLLLFVPAFAPVLAVLLARWIPKYEPTKDHVALNLGLIVLIAIGLTRAFPSREQLKKLVASGFPTGAADYLRQHPVDGPMFNTDIWGAYLIRSLGKKHKIFMDGRSQLYEEAGVFGDYVRIMEVDRDAATLLGKYGVEACLIQRRTPLATFLSVLPDWERAYEDDISVIFVRKRQRLPPGFPTNSDGVEAFQKAEHKDRRPAAPAEFSPERKTHRR